MERLIRYYVCGHTANGYFNYLKSNLHGINQIVILSGESNALKTKIFRRLINHLTKQSMIEVIHNSYSRQYIDGIILRSESIAFLCEHLIEWDLEKVTTVDLNALLNENKQNERLHLKRKKYAEKAYVYFKKALQIHDELENIYISRMDFEKANKVADNFIKTLLKGVHKKDGKGHLYERFFGTNTSDGAVNVIEHLIRNIKNRVFIKGRAGTGKSVFMRKVLEACQSYNLTVEVYYCSFDPKSIDMLIIRDLNYCLFDSTPPHEFFPEDEYDKVIDLYELAVAKGTDEQFKEQIKRVTKKYKEQLKFGLSELRKIKAVDRIDRLDLHRLSSEQFNDIIDEMLSYI